MPFYIVTERSNGTETKFLVSAKNQATALRAVVEPRFSVALAETEEAVRMAGDGTKVINAEFELSSNRAAGAVDG